MNNRLEMMKYIFFIFEFNCMNYLSLSSNSKNSDLESSSMPNPVVLEKENMFHTLGEENERNSNVQIGLGFDSLDRPDSSGNLQNKKSDFHNC